MTLHGDGRDNRSINTEKVKKMNANVQQTPCSVVIQKAHCAGFAFSQQGSSHVLGGKPCQDYCDMRYLVKQRTLIAVMADGLGSCSLSHIGAACAVQAALDTIAGTIQTLPVSAKGRVKFDYEALFDRAFTVARQSVERLAEEQQRPVPVYQSTLTAVIYNAGTLYCCHVGDDGVVARFSDGTVGMVTRRMKGEEANSVYPLQTGMWEVTVSPKQVSGFMMATDGVLDAFVKDARHIPYFEGIYYPFMASAMDRLERENADEVAKFYDDYVNNPTYRQKVQDDLTIVAVIDPKLSENSVTPRFDEKRWAESVNEWKQRVERELNGKGPVITKPGKKDPPPPPPPPKKPQLANLIALLLAALLLLTLLWKPWKAQPNPTAEGPMSTVSTFNTTAIQTTPSAISTVNTMNTSFNTIDTTATPTSPFPDSTESTINPGVNQDNNGLSQLNNTEKL